MRRAALVILGVLVGVSLVCLAYASVLLIVRIVQ